MKKSEMYIVGNIYDIQGHSLHRTSEAAFKAASKREGIGWHVIHPCGSIISKDCNGKIHFLDQ